MSSIIQDLKSTLIDTAKTRLTDIPNANFHVDLIKGEHERPFCEIIFNQRVKVSKGFLGTVLYDYAFTVTIGNKVDDDDPIETRSRQIETLFSEGETINFSHFDEQKKFSRVGLIRVKTFKVQEGGKDRQGNKIKAELVVTF
jgi:hypothetical protein